MRHVGHSWFTSYLGNRTQFRCVNGYDSDRLSVIFGVPKRSVLGPRFLHKTGVFEDGRFNGVIEIPNFNTKLAITQLA